MSDLVCIIIISCLPSLLDLMSGLTSGLSSSRLIFQTVPMLKLDGDANIFPICKFGRNFIRKLVVKLRGNERLSTDDCDIFYLSYDCWKSTTERHNAVFQGIVEVGGQTKNAIKHRINAGDKASNSKDETVASIFDNKVCILLNFEILKFSLPLYLYGLGSQLTYELTFADYSDVIKTSNTSYTISNIFLEFDTVTNTSLSCQIRTKYMKSSILYDRILRSRIIPLKDSVFQWILTVH